MTTRTGCTQTLLSSDYIFFFHQRNRVFDCLLFGQAALVFSEFIFNRMRPKKKRKKERKKKLSCARTPRQTYARPSQTAANPVGNGADCPMPRTNSRRRLVASLLRPRADVANAPPDVNCAVAWCERTRIQAECTERGRRSCDREHLFAAGTNAGTWRTESARLELC